MLELIEFLQFGMLIQGVYKVYTVRESSGITYVQIERLVLKYFTKKYST